MNALKTNSFFIWLQHLPQVYSMCFEMIMIVVLTIVISISAAVVYKRLHPKLKKTRNLWDDIFLQALHLPLQIVIWSYGVFYVIDTFSSLIPINYLQTTGLFREVIAVAAFVWFLLRYIKLFEARLVALPTESKKRRVDKATTFAIGKLMRLAVAAIAFLFLLQLVGVKVSALVAIGGASTLVVGFAAKDMLANFFGGLMIYTDRPFTVGDWIRSPDRNIEGTVEFIGWRLTRIRTFDKRPLYVANSIFSNIAIENPSRMLNRRIKTTIGVRYDDIKRVPSIVNGIQNMLKAHPDIDTSQTLFVRLVEFAGSTVNLQIYTFTKTTDWVKFMEVQEDVLLKVAGIIEQNDAEMAFPTQTLEIPKGVLFTNTESEK